MNRRNFLTRTLAAGGLLLAGAACDRNRVGAADAATAVGADEAVDFPPVDITREEWKQILSPERFRILFRDGTERAFTSPLDKQYDPGTYICAACRLPLFDSEDKFDSRTGWPSFTRPLPGRVATKTDYKLVFPRTEYHCVRCGGHQGHVFDDGPEPTGQRWCNNGLALLFIPRRETPPPLRTTA